MLNRILPWAWAHPPHTLANRSIGRCLLALIVTGLLVLPLASLAADESPAEVGETDEDAAAASESEEATSDGTPRTDADDDRNAETGDSGRLGIELNKLEQVEEICRVYFVFENALDHKLETLQLELVLFDTKGFIKRRLTLDAAPIDKDKTSVKLFDLPETQCTNVGRILINDVVKIAGPEGGLPNDVSQLKLSSKLDANLFK